MQKLPKVSTTLLSNGMHHFDAIADISPAIILNVIAFTSFFPQLFEIKYIFVLYSYS